MKVRQVKDVVQKVKVREERAEVRANVRAKRAKLNVVKVNVVQKKKKKIVHGTNNYLLNKK